jgi:tetratricopeptide (TPR) repeat protein
VLVGARAAGVMRPVWYSFGPAEGRRWVQVAQQRVTAETPAAIMAALDVVEASLATNLGQHRAGLTAAERALARYRELADPHGIATAEAQIGRLLLMLGKIAEAEALLPQALDAFRSLGARKSLIFPLDSLAFARQLAGDCLERDNATARRWQLRAPRARSDPPQSLR